MENKEKKINAVELDDDMLDKVSGGTSETESGSGEDAGGEYSELLKPVTLER